MELIPHAFERFQPVRTKKRFAASVLATVLSTNLSTGTKMLPVWYRAAGSAAGLVTFFDGSGGGSIFNINFAAGGAETSGPWWDVSATTANTNLEFSIQGDPGSGYMEMWFIVVPAASSPAQ